MRDEFVNGVKGPEDVACGEVIGGEGGSEAVVFFMGVGERSIGNWVGSLRPSGRTAIVFVSERSTTELNAKNDSVGYQTNQA